MVGGAEGGLANTATRGPRLREAGGCGDGRRSVHRLAHRAVREYALGWPSRGPRQTARGKCGWRLGSPCSAQLAQLGLTSWHASDSHSWHDARQFDLMYPGLLSHSPVFAQRTQCSASASTHAEKSRRSGRNELTAPSSARAAVSSRPKDKATPAKAASSARRSRAELCATVGSTICGCAPSRSLFPGFVLSTMRANFGLTAVLSPTQRMCDSTSRPSCGERRSLLVTLPQAQSTGPRRPTRPHTAAAVVVPGGSRWAGSELLPGAAQRKMSRPASAAGSPLLAPDTSLAHLEPWQSPSSPFARAHAAPITADARPTGGTEVPSSFGPGSGPNGGPYLRISSAPHVRARPLSPGLPGAGPSPDVSAARLGRKWDAAPLVPPFRHASWGRAAGEGCGSISGASGRTSPPHAPWAAGAAVAGAGAAGMGTACVRAAGLDTAGMLGARARREAGASMAGEWATEARGGGELIAIGSLHADVCGEAGNASAAPPDESGWGAQPGASYTSECPSAADPSSLFSRVASVADLMGEDPAAGTDAPPSRIPSRCSVRVFVAGQSTVPPMVDRLAAEPVEGGWVVTVMPMKEPGGALDVPLLEQVSGKEGDGGGGKRGEGGVRGAVWTFRCLSGSSPWLHVPLTPPPITHHPLLPTRTPLVSTPFSLIPRVHVRLPYPSFARLLHPLTPPFLTFPRPRPIPTPPHPPPSSLPFSGSTRCTRCLRATFSAPWQPTKSTRC
jgi:hypothetical protein